jgi:hypothetical protein
MIHWLWSGLLRFVARHRAVSLAILSAVASVLLGLAVTEATRPESAAWTWWLLGGAAVGLIVLAGAVPSEYVAAERLDFILPVIHKVLNLAPEDRLTVHRVRSLPRRGYEQITEYYPPQRKRTRGRTFGLNHGIVAHVLAHPGEPDAWDVPDDQSFEEAMLRRWSFNPAEMRSLTPDRKSFLAYPIGQDREWARAVLYIDSPRAETFRGAAGQAAIERIRDTFDAQLVHALQG